METPISNNKMVEKIKSRNQYGEFEFIRHKGNFKKGQRVSPKTEFKKGCIPWNKGKELYHLREENSPSWKGAENKIIARRIAKRNGKDLSQCQICSEKEKRIEIHHIDGNRRNNNYKNLSVVCSYCHFAIHDNGKNTRFKRREVILN